MHYQKIDKNKQRKMKKVTSTKANINAQINVIKKRDIIYNYMLYNT